MERIKIKICGMKYPKNIVEVGMLLPDYMGFIFWEKSIRYFNSIIPKLPKSIKKTGVFVNAELTEIQNKITQHQLQAIQLHGDESPEIVRQLKEQNLSIEIIKVFSIKDHFDFAVLEPFEKNCDYYLFDTKGKLPGGNGFTFNWEIMKKYPSSKPFFLSGGIGTEELKNIENILKIKLPLYAVDLNSKLETEPGLKNINNCKEVFEYLLSKR